jgi:K+-transporting ATPase ATPase C chain
MNLLATLRPALVLLALFTALTGVGYPLLVTGIAQAAFRSKANGSLIVDAKGIRGSALIGQHFDDPKYFWGRPSATSPVYDGAASSGSNLGPSNPALLAAIEARVVALHRVDPGNTEPIPVDLVTASASGLDPHLSPAAALYQARRVGSRRGLGEERVRKLVEQHTEGRALGILGEPGVNVLQLNLALDALR